VLRICCKTTFKGGNLIHSGSLDEGKDVLRICCKTTFKGGNLIHSV